MDALRRKLEINDWLQASSPDWTLVDLLAVLQRRRVYLLLFLAGSLLLVTIYCLFATRRFQAVGDVEIEKDPPVVFGLENRINGDAPNTAPDSLDYSMTLETEANILKSPTLALQVIHDLKLEATHDYFPARHSSFQLPAWLVFWSTPIEPASEPLDDAPNRRYVALKIFASHLKVTPETGTRLIEIRYSDPDPHLAAAVVNRLFQALNDSTSQNRFHATAQASSWLASQLAELRRRAKSLDDKANALQRSAGVYGGDAAHDVVLDRLDALNQRMTAAESSRLLAEAVDRISQSGDPEQIASLAGSALALGSPSLSNSLSLIQTLRSREADVQAQIAEADARYGAAHPHLAELHSELDGVQSSIRSEVTRIGQRAHADFEIAQTAESAAHDAFDKQRAMADELSGKAVAYRLAKEEADGSRSVYRELSARLEEAGVLEGLQSTNITVVDPARVPPTHHPRSPNVPLYYAAALVGGIFMGSLAAVTAEISDQTIHSFDGLERLTGSPLLAALPHLQSGRAPHRLLPHVHDRAASKQPLFLYSHETDSSVFDLSFLEALRSLRTSLLLLRSGRRSQVILVTSSIAGEGKSKVAVNLAGVLAQLGARVLLVDADLRRPSMHNELDLHDCAGLGSALMNNYAAEIRVCEKLHSLFVLCGCEPIRMPAELLASSRMAELLHHWRREYDFVLMDSPPLLPTTDALVLSQMSDITLLIARHGFTPKPAIHRAMAMLQNQVPETCHVRAVLNDVHSGSYDFREYYGYEPASAASPSLRWERKHAS